MIDLIQTVYEGQSYKFDEGNWVDNRNNLVVTNIMSTFLSRQAVSEGASPELFGGSDELEEKAKETKVKRTPKKIKPLFNLKKGISLNDEEEK